MDYLTITEHDNVAILMLNQLGEKVNKLDEQLISEVEAFLDDFETKDDWIGAVLISGKDDTFIAGADIEMLSSKATPKEITELSTTGHNLLRRIENSSKPIAAAIHGPCMGGGLEVIMACHYRVASHHSKTKMGLPEVKLGLCPGAGGTQRLPRIIGLQKSLAYILTGKDIYARKAKKLGLVDELTHRGALLDAGIKAVKNIHEKKHLSSKDKRSIGEKLLEGNPIGRSIIFSQARKRTKGKTKGNYPAPLRIIDCMEEGYKNGMEAGLELEAKTFGELAFTPESKNLVQLFFGMQKAKDNGLKDQKKPVRQLGVLGAGLMGHGIAEVSAEKGDLRVLLKDVELENAAKGEKEIYKALTKKVEKHIITEFERDRLMSLVTGTDSYEGFGKVDLVIEAVFEDLDLKRTIVNEVEANTREDCIFASNTSSLPISDIARDAGRPEQVIGMHYFSPVPKMPLLEIITTDQTADWVTATAIEAGLKQGKHVIVVNDGPGFYTTRILAPYMNEAIELLNEGAKIEQLDKAMKQFGFPVGPVALFDEVGIDVGAHVADTMSDLFAERGVEASNKGHELLDAGYKGRKNRKGFYKYEEGSKKKKEINPDIYEFFGGSDRKDFDDEEIQQRMALTMVNEAAWCLQDEILTSPDDGDLGAILGLGFPPFRGGPFRYIDAEGAGTILNRLEGLHSKHGNRFKPAQILEDYAKDESTFHS